MLATLGHEYAQLVRNRSLLWMLSRRELSARNAGSALGLLWLYLQPLGLLAAYFLLFDVVFGVRLDPESGTRRLGAYLVVGMIPWMCFADSLQRGTASLVESGTLLQKTALPLVLFPARAVIAGSLVFLPFFLALVVFASIRHGSPGVVLFAPLLFLAQLTVMLLLAYLLAIVTAAMRDVQQVVGFLLAIGLFCSPVLYPQSMLPDGLAWLLWLNPMTPLVVGWQEVVLLGGIRSATILYAVAAWIVGACVLLALFLRRAREQIVDWL
ncbi:ABC transporter permease [Pseudazoarcus pumilus]|uniref:ABC transporter n=1 Tax=Pseudazoarcus pumilus TaxID=2067960 RepID=A0A2I6S921_9RHOO|nr:ABC transporter permease [Pseudazoarcus pumilus]AUN95747.1 ABC transporter [Pseudazoarcus pumilus]